MKTQDKSVKCNGCDRTVLRSVAYKKDGKLYCCADCAEGRTCDCQ